MHRNEENLTEYYTTPVVSEIYTKSSIDEGNCTFMNSISVHYVGNEAGISKNYW
jgi:hypothetical protein